MATMNASRRPASARWWMVSVLAIVFIGAVAVSGMRRSERPPATAGGTVRPNVLLLVPDTLRADRLDASRDGRPVTPVLRGLAARGVRFDHARSQSGWTLPSLAALFTGRWPLLPPNAGGEAPRWTPADARSLAELFGLYGYDTAVFFGASAAGIAEEFTRGFGVVREVPEQGGAEAVRTWITSEAGEPWLAVLHDADLQFVRDAEPGLVDRALGALGKGLGGFVGLDELHARHRGTLPPPAAREATVAAYDAAVTAWDASLAPLVAAVDPARTVVVATSHHGIELGEGGLFRHGTTGEDNLRVPLVIVAPGAPAKARRQAVTQTVDLAPTLLALAGIPVDATMVGRSLVRLLAAEGDLGERAIFSVNTRTSLAVRAGRWKLERVYLERPPPGQPAGEADLLADLVEDPLGRKNVAALHPEEASALSAALTAWRDARLAESAGRAATPDPELEAALKARGYWE